jgi:hypothetical protein
VYITLCDSPSGGGRVRSRGRNSPTHHACDGMVGVAQLVRALGCGPRGRGFDSPRLPVKTLSELTPKTALALAPVGMGVEPTADRPASPFSVRLHESALTCTFGMRFWSRIWSSPTARPSVPVRRAWAAVGDRFHGPSLTRTPKLPSAVTGHARLPCPSRRTGPASARPCPGSVWRGPCRSRRTGSAPARPWPRPA